MRRFKLTAFAVLSVALLTATASGVSASDYHRSDSGGEATYTATFTNVNNGQQYLTPPNFAAHDDDVEVWDRGDEASAGVQAVAENGDVPALAAELTGNIDAKGLGVSGVGSGGVEGPLKPGESRTFEFTTTERHISVVSMIVCTNDGFAGLDSRNLPRRDGQTKTYRLRGFDAGTEINTEMRADLVPAPFCGEGEGSGASNPELAENGKIRRHRTLQGVGDLNPALDWSGVVAELRITRVDTPATYTITAENINNGQQWLTPPNFAIHDRGVHVFQRGQAASAGVQAVAENGGVSVLAAELKSALDDAGLGVSGVIAGDRPGVPLNPGDSRTVTVQASGSRLSVVSMVVCTNDGFAGLDSNRLPQWRGESRTYYVRAFDAGTEKNTEMRADLVPAPFCGEGEGSGASNPELAENGKIRRHRTLRGVGDLDPALDWSGPVMKITVTRG